MKDKDVGRYRELHVSVSLICLHACAYIHMSSAKNIDFNSKFLIQTHMTISYYDFITDA